MSRLPARIDDLPTSMVDVAETLGLRVVLSLIQNFGGCDLRFPVRPGPDHPVIKALGETDGYALCHFLNGEKLYVPHARRPRSVLADVRRMEAQGMDRGAIARALGVSQRHVRRMSNRSGDDRQRDLFD
jgi:hypothetical protein